MGGCVNGTDSKHHIQVLTGTGHNTKVGSGAEPHWGGEEGRCPPNSKKHSRATVEQL